MTGQVIEIRLSAPRPNFLQILAQPQMGISGKNGGAGPYRRERRGKAWLLTPVRDESDSGEEEPPAPRSARRVLRAERDRKSTRLNSSHYCASRMQSCARK